MPNSFFQFKQFTVYHDRCAMKVTTDACLFGAWAAKQIQHSKLKIQNILDIGCGTGLLSLMVAQKNKADIDAIEIDNDAAEQAKENVTASPWPDTINIIHSDVRHWAAGKKYHCIISNPPFYEAELKSGKERKNIAHHSEGLKLKELFGFIKSHLEDDGIFFLLLPAKRENEIEGILKQSCFYLHRKTIVRQSVNHTPFRLMLQAGNKKEEPAQNEMAIKNKNGDYTAEFIALLKDYYLFL